QAFSLVDRAAFRRLLMFQHPSTKDCDIPHHTSIAKAVHEKAQKVKDILKELFAIGWITSDNVTSNDKMMACLAHIFPVDASPTDLDEDSETWYASGDTLGKLWAFINQVRLSPQASAFFFKCCAEEGLPCLELIKYVQMRWSSMYDLLECAFLLKPVSSPFSYPLHRS
ncbi:hypothetical protein EI94DRAFT_1624901, partial [Lactarius quietus]